MDSPTIFSDTFSSDETFATMRKSGLRYQAFEDCASLPPLMAFVRDSPMPYFEARSDGIRYLLSVSKVTEFKLIVETEFGNEREHVFTMPQYERSPLHWRFPQMVSADICRYHARLIDFPTAMLKKQTKQFLAEVAIVSKRHLQLTIKQALAIRYLQIAVGAPGHWNLTASDPVSAWVDEHGDVFLNNLPKWLDLRPSAYLSISRGYRPGLRMIEAAVIRLEGGSVDVFSKLRAIAALQEHGVAKDEIAELVAYGDRLASQ